MGERLVRNQQVRGSSPLVSMQEALVRQTLTGASFYARGRQIVRGYAGATLTKISWPSGRISSGAWAINAARELGLLIEVSMALLFA